MLEIAVYDGRKRVRGGLALGVGLGLLAAMFVAMYPSITTGMDLDQYLEALPAAMVNAFGLRALNTIEGFVAAELYAWGWVILLGLYFAYSAASTVANDVERGRMDVLLSLPVTRGAVVRQKFLALLVPILLVNLLVLPVVYVGTVLIDEPIAFERLFAVHALSVPYLLTCGAVGLGFSVLFDRAAIAQRAAMGVIFGLFLVESVVTSTDFAALGAVSPSRYYDPTAVLVDGSYDLGGAVVLLVAAVVLVAASQVWFATHDVR